MSTSIYPSQDVPLFDTQYYDSTHSSRGRILLWFIVGLSVVGICISGYLTWTTWTSSSVAGCSGDGEGCSHVLTSVWSKWMGLPVSLFGLLAYLGILTTALLTTRDDQGWGPTLLLTLSLTAAGSAAWFIGLQLFVIEHFCMYCMTVHCCSLLICTLSVVYLFLQGNAVPREAQMSALLGVAPSPEAYYDDAALAPNVKPIAASAIASLGLVVLIAGQFIYKEYFRPSGLLIEEVAATIPEAESTTEETPSTEVASVSAHPPAIGAETTQTGHAVEANTDADSIAASPDVDSEVEQPTADLDPSDEGDILAGNHDSEPLDDEEFLASLTDDETSEPTSVTEEPIAAVEDSTSTAQLPDFSAEEPDSGAIVPAEMVEETDQEAKTLSVGKRDQNQPRLITFPSLKEPIDVTQVPILGDPFADHVLLEMLDYTCPHCRHLHPHVEASLERYGDQVAFVIVHVPLSKKCNPYVQRDHWSHKSACDLARMALGVWKLDRSKFFEFHCWLMEGERPPSSVEAKEFAMKLVGEKILTSEHLKSEIFNSFSGNSDTMMRMNSGLPLILTAKGKVSGIPNNDADWFSFLENNVGVKPVD